MGLCICILDSQEISEFKSVQAWIKPEKKSRYCGRAGFAVVFVQTY